MKLRPQLTILTTVLFASGWFACTSEPEVFTGDGDISLGDGDGDGDSGDGDLNVGDGDGDNGDGDGDSGDGDSGDSDNNGMGGGGIFVPEWEFPDDVDFPYTPITGGGETCGSVEGTPESVSRPIDIIFIIDNSSSMSNEIKEVEQNIKANFADIIEASGIDYRVILISRYGDNEGPDAGGSDFQVCIPPALGATACTDPQMEALSNNAPTFFHYSADIESKDALCVILESFDEPDEFDDQDTTNDGPVGSAYRSWTSLAPNGWMDWLRPDAFKTFVMMSDDDADCGTNAFAGFVNDQDHQDISFDDEDGVDRVADSLTVAQTFDSRLLAMSPTQFGTAMERNYIWHSIVGLEENDPETTVWEPTDALQTTTCDSGSSGPGLGYQQLSIMTGGLRYPICPTDNGMGMDVTNFDPIFNEIAQGVIETAAIPCEFDFPMVNGIINPDNIKVRYAPSGGGAEVEFNRVTDEPSCTGGDDFYFDDNVNPTKLFLCGSACTTVQNDGGEITLDFGCLGS